MDSGSGIPYEIKHALKLLPRFQDIFFYISIGVSYFSRSCHFLCSISLDINYKIRIPDILTFFRALSNMYVMFHGQVHFFKEKYVILYITL